MDARPAARDDAAAGLPGANGADAGAGAAARGAALAADAVGAPGDADDARDADLLGRFAAGDAAAFARLYERHERRVYRFLLRLVGERAVADELHQETWIAVVRHAAHWTPQARFSTWLFGIARNKAVDHWRARDPALRLDEADPAAPDDADAPGTLARWFERIAADARGEPERQALARARAAALARAVEQLPPVQREVFLLHAEGGLSIEEVARLTGAGSETVKSRFRYALGRLRTALEDWR